MSAYLNLRLNGREADAVHTVLALVLNDPDWLPGSSIEARAVASADGKLVKAIRAATK